MEKVEIELISFGNELLIGEIVNTNSHWLAQVFSQAGAVITRILTISDSLEDISTAFMESLRRNPNIIVSTGGLGPTWDDQTLIGLAKAVDKKIIQNKTAIKMIQDKYNEINIELSQSGIKMANMPAGSRPLSNREGTAPGVQFIYNKTNIFCLPGIPKEMKFLVNEHVLPYIKKLNPNNQFYETKFLIKGSYESKLAETTSKYAQKYPPIYIKSHPKKDEITMHLTTYGSKTEKTLLDNVTKELRQDLSKYGIIEELY